MRTSTSTRRTRRAPFNASHRALALSLSLSLGLVCGGLFGSQAMAQDHPSQGEAVNHAGSGGTQHGSSARAGHSQALGHMGIEPQGEPRGYGRLTPPAGTEARPKSLDRGGYNHNFAAGRAYHLGPYRSTGSWHYRRWYYGEMLPAAYWGQQYWLSEYWLFGLDLPPEGYEWVRYGPDAILVDSTTGEVIQVVYNIFA